MTLWCFYHSPTFKCSFFEQSQSNNVQNAKLNGFPLLFPSMTKFAEYKITFAAYFVNFWRQSSLFFFHGSGRSSTRRMRELQCKTGTIWLVLRFGVISKRETILYKFHKVCAHLYSGTHSLLALCCLYYNTLRRYERLCIIHSPFSTVDPIC